MWHSLQVRVPSKMVVLSPQGKPRMKDTLSALGNLARFHKQASIELIPVQTPEAKIAFDLAKANQPEAKKEYLKKVAARESARKSARASAPTVHPPHISGLDFEPAVLRFLKSMDDDVLQPITETLNELGKIIDLNRKTTKARLIISAYRAQYRIRKSQMSVYRGEVKEETEQREDKPVERRMVSEVPQLAEPKEAKKAKLKKAEPKSEPKAEKVKSMRVEIVWTGGKKYIMRYFIGDKMIKAIEYVEDQVPRVEAEKQIYQWYHKNGLMEKYNLVPFYVLKDNIHMV